MNGHHGLAEKVRKGQPLSPPLSALLSLGTVPVRLGMWRRLRMPAERLSGYVISIGNLTAGGTGKTPAVIERAKKEIAKGNKVAVLTRGYGAPAGDPILVSTDLAGRHEHYLLGDEPALMLEKVPGLIVVKSADRAAAARRAAKYYDCFVFILDDGYQYTQLARDENILLLDASLPFGNGRRVPRGILREGLDAMKRATEIVLTRCDQAPEMDVLLSIIRQHCPHTPIRRTYHKAVSLTRQSTGEDVGLEWLGGRPVKALCGIGNPDAFFATLEGFGADLRERISLPDHGAIPSEALAGRDVIVTEKDAMRLGKTVENVFVLGVELCDYAPNSKQ